jgi:transcriptional regulator with XRE-family HTH domain
MPKERNSSSYANLGRDIKEARNVMGISRKELAEMVSIVPRYLANIENSGSLPSLPVFYELIKICRLPVERYFYQLNQDRDSQRRSRTTNKLKLCPEQYLPIIEACIDEAIRMESFKENQQQ